MMRSKGKCLVCLGVILFSASAQLGGPGIFNSFTARAASVLIVNKTSGPYTSINAAINAAASGDTIEITDSAIYYETINIGPDGKNITNLLIKGREGEQPVISGEGQTGAVVQLKNTHCAMKNLTVYVGGALYGVACSGPNINLDGLSFNNEIAGAGDTFCVLVTNSTAIVNCNFLGKPAVNGGAILAQQPSTPINLTVYQCDFYGTGKVGGMVGMGLAPGANVIVSRCCFAADNTPNTIIGINSWGNGNITENWNFFRNVYGRVSGFNNNTPDSTDVVSNGPVAPASSSVLMTDASLSSLISWLGAVNEYGWAYPDANTVRSSLNKAIRSEGFNQFNPGYYDTVLNIPLYQNTLDLVEYAQPKMWFDFAVSWNRQFDPSVWAYIKKCANDVRSQPGLSNIILQGYCMEAIGKTAVNNTPMDQTLWLFFARNFPNASFRPLETKIINGRRWQGHWFNYDLMLGAGRNMWAADVSAPNLNQQEAFLYYIYLIKSYIDAGMNDVSFAQPQLTFGQYLNQTGYGGACLRMVSRFARNYGHYYANPVNGQRFVICGLSTSYWYLKSYADYFNYTRGPAGVSNNQGFGAPWNTLSDAWNTMPPADIVIGNKPYIAELDNFGANDQISTFAHASPPARNAFILNFTSELLADGFYLMQPGLEPINPEGSQSFTGYLTPPNLYVFTNHFMPFQEYSGFESVMKSIFDSH